MSDYLRGQLDLIERLENSVIGYNLSYLGFVGVITDKKLKEIKKELTGQNKCDFCTKPCMTDWCITKENK